MANIKHNPGRADTNEKKEALVKRLLVAWKSVPDQRLGQFLFNAIDEEDMFFMEDSRLIEVLENYLKG